MKNLLTQQDKVKTIPILFFLLFLTVCLFGKLLLNEKRVVFLFGYSSFVVSSPSMHPEYPINSVVFIKKSELKSVEVGDCVVYKSNALGGKLAFHRVVRIEDGYLFTKGDNNRLEDFQPIDSLSFVGKGVAKLSFFARYISLVSSAKGFVALMLLPFGSVVLSYFTAKNYVLRRKKL